MKRKPKANEKKNKRKKERTNKAIKYKVDHRAKKKDVLEPYAFPKL